MNNNGDVLLRAKNLVKHFQLKSGGQVRAVDDVSLFLRRGETLSIVGESGCGKSTLARTLIRLHEPQSGEIVFEKTDLKSLTPKQMRGMRRHIQMVFQDPFASLDARRNVGKTIMEPMKIHGIGDAKSRWQKMSEILDLVGIDLSAAERYPHEFSGGQRQRICIARAIAVEPALIVADEPVSALDVSIQSQILNLLVDLRQKLGLSYLFISHDLAVVKHVSDRVAVMYLGQIVEQADKTDLFSKPSHPYTEALLSAIPHPSLEKTRERIILKGDIPDPSQPPSGCRFHPRCHRALQICALQKPHEYDLGSATAPHIVRCHLYAK